MSATERTVRVHRCQPVGETHAPKTTIVIDEELQYVASRARDDDSPAMFQQDAKAIVDALFDALPGGTIDQVVVEMLRRKASQFRVRF